MTAHDEVLGAVRRALANAPTEPAHVPRGYRSTPAPSDVVALFVERVADYRAVVERCSADEVTDRIGGRVHQGPAYGAQPLVAGTHR